ncbi:hypothetical protein SAMN05444007_102336 [Cribrihabitans marinus]|uniref:Transmembrane protein (PGPGW) n=1 Tax=Cribrihabitans marinus TaxID=1227549 RepID=A0A1H6TCX7_9RHOB|nr:hypothetical protein [Cribrihabitans marinus]GGH21958.1 hypothetical protein GCM10010973_06900 [Cribrihabitans marinus]SEI77963.1 hypothetical protein SAMN05444007_102336 [Cribrihabitans marinus]
MTDDRRKPTLRERLRPYRARIRSNVPRGLRIVVGVLLILGGFLGFLPVLGFWMIPLGVMVAALDVELYRRWRRRKTRRR